MQERFNNLTVDWISGRKHINRSPDLWMACRTKCLTDVSHFEGACMCENFAPRRSHSLISIPSCFLAERLSTYVVCVTLYVDRAK